MSAWILTSLAMVNICYSMSHLVRILSVAGTYRRYRAATLQWAVLVPALAYRPADAILKGFDVWTLLYLSDLWFAHMLVTSDDDNWWRRTRKRLRSWARTVFTIRTPQPAGAAT